MFCDPSFCPVAYRGLLAVGLVLALFAVWFFLRTRVAATFFGVFLSLSHLRTFRAPRPLSRRGRIYWLVVAEGLILYGLIVPGLDYLVPPWPQHASVFEFLTALSFGAALVGLFLMRVDIDRALEKDSAG